MTPEQIAIKPVPVRLLPLPHPKHKEGGFVFPRFVIDDQPA
jgi:hypothetical protein